MSVKTALNKAFKIMPKSQIAKRLGISYQSMNQWHDKNKLPRTEWSGETNWAQKIQELTEGKVTVTDLLGSVPPHQA